MAKTYILKSAILIISFLLSSCSTVYKIKIEWKDASAETEQEEILNISIFQVKEIFKNYNLTEKECTSKKKTEDLENSQPCVLIVDVKKPLMIEIQVTRYNGGSLLKYSSNGLNSRLDNKAKSQIYSVLLKKYQKVSLL